MRLLAGVAYRGWMNSWGHLPAAPGCALCGLNAMRRLAFGLAGVLCLGLVAPAQARTCEEVQADIAETMDAAGLRGYSLQIVPAGAPLAGTRVVGRCAGGARKITYRRFALPQAQPHVSEALLPPSSEPAPSLAAPAPEPKAKREPEPRLEPKPVVVAEPAPPPSQAPEPVVAQKALTAEAVPASHAVDALPASASLTPALLDRHWPWLALLLLLPLLAWLLRWRGGGVDAAGLPRGPRL